MSVRNCLLPWHLMQVTNDGDVTPCCHGSKPVGNLRDGSIEEIWNGRTMQEVRACILKGEPHPVCRSDGCPFQRVDAVFPEPREPLHVEESFARAFDEEWYLRENPDVRDAVRMCRLTCGLEHFIRHGRAEGRGYRLAVGEGFGRSFDEEYYLQANPDVREAVDRHSLSSGLEHFLRHGWVEGRGFRLMGPEHTRAPAGDPGAPGHTLRLGNGPPIIATKPIRNAVLALIEYSKGATLLRAKPVDLVVVPSTICNLRCVMCPHGMRLVDGPHHTPVEFVAKVEPFLATVSRILVSGLGEPISAPAFWWIIDHSGRREDLSFRTHTNGHLVTPEGAERILKSGLTEISCSLDAATSDTYSKIRGGDFASALAGISTLLRLREKIPNKGMEISINMTLMRENLSEAVPFIALAKRLGCDAVIFSQLFAFGDRPEWQVNRGIWKFRYSEQRLSRVPSEARDQLSRAREFAQKVGMPVHFFSNTSDYLKG